ncbi:MAG: 16S rRNA (guanine(966)-N(2))-methyltransferase RsmD [Desulfovibrio sp.]|nr:16S rRNA (guanine(966)-N(2))-methyltransferase RsmD [Desulfovibrio sp.]
MRIIAGKFRSRLLKSPDGRECRPAMGRTREALFSMLEARGLFDSDIRVLDIFAGSGSLAFEAISRGAKEAVLLEQSPAVLACIEANIRALGLEDCVTVIAKDALRVLRRGTEEGFDLVFLDPPYRKDYAQKCLPLLAEKGWLLPGASILAEVEHDLPLSVPASFSLETERLFGQTRVLFMHYTPSV